MTDSSRDASADQTAMLFSTDWFLPYWSSIGIDADEDRKRCFQQGCRKVVLDLIDSASEYYLINFSPERTAKTRKQLQTLIQRCAFTEEASRVLEDLIAYKAFRQELYKTAWMFRMVLDELMGDDSLTGEIRRIIQNVIDANAPICDLDFEQSCLKSRTKWDQYIRGLTPELPSMLADLVSVSLLASRQLEGILIQLNQDQRESLRSRFRVAAKELVKIHDYWPTITSTEQTT